MMSSLFQISGDQKVDMVYFQGDICWIMVQVDNNSSSDARSKCQNRSTDPFLKSRAELEREMPENLAGNQDQNSRICPQRSPPREKKVLPMKPHPPWAFY